MISLYPEQQEIFNKFDEALQREETLLLPDSVLKRGGGKTTILNELSFTYQALGYEVLLFNPVYKREFFYATKPVFTRQSFFPERLAGITHAIKYIAIFDNFRYFPIDVQSEIKEILFLRGIPYVGFVGTRCKDTAQTHRGN